MKLTKKVQYGVLLIQHITDNGRSSLKDISDALYIPHSFLEQIGRTLRLAGIIRSVRGPGGGYETVGEPTLLEVTRALDPKYLGIRPSVEGRVLDSFTTRVSSAIDTALRVKFTDLRKHNAWAITESAKNV